MTAEDLVATARQLKLTNLQRRFCEALWADPERNQARSAEQAGYNGTAAKTWAQKTLAKPHVQEYMAALEGVPVTGEVKEAVLATQQAIADRAEVLERMTAMSRGDVPTRVVDDPKAGRTETYDAAKATDMLARAHKIYEDRPHDVSVSVAEVIRALDPGQRTATARALLRGEPIEAEAKRLP